MSFLRANQNIAIIRERIITDLFPDVCKLRPSKGTSGSITGAGYVVDTPAAFKLYRDSVSIPCRYDHARAFRPDEINVQTAVVSEYNLQLPYDLDIDVNDHVIFDEGLESEKIFEIRKMKKASAWDYTVEALIMVVSTDFNV